MADFTSNAILSSNAISVSVSIPAALRPFADGKRTVDVPGATVGEALGALTAAYPDLKRHLFDEEGRLRGFVNIFVGEENIKGTGGLSTVLSEGALVSVVPAIAGGNGRC